jgi:hypothetical protein
MHSNCCSSDHRKAGMANKYANNEQRLDEGQHSWPADQPARVDEHRCMAASTICSYQSCIYYPPERQHLKIPIRS